MKNPILFLVVFVFGNLSPIMAQSTAPTPAPSQPASNRVVRAGGRTSMPVARDSNTNFEQLRSLEIKRTEEKLLPDNPLMELEETIYRKPNKEEIKALSPSPNLFDKYAALLSQPDTGLVKLNADSTCVEKTGVVVAKENCLQYSIPGAGTAFSFRIENYRIPHLADLILTKDVFKTDGALQQGVMVKLGDVAPEAVTPETKGLKYLLDFKPAENLADLQKYDRDLAKGIEADGYLYRLGFYVDNQSTFALRSIAYRGELVRSVKGIKYNELDFDKRKDIVVIFRVVEKDTNGNITLLWKILAKNNSPVLKIKQTK